MALALLGLGGCGYSLRGTLPSARRPETSRATSSPWPWSGSDGLDYSHFVRDAERGQLPPLVLIHGTDAQLLDDALAVATRARFPDPGLAAFGRDVLDAR